MNTRKMFFLCNAINDGGMFLYELFTPKIKFELPEINLNLPEVSLHQEEMISTIWFLKNLNYLKIDKLVLFWFRNLVLVY